MSTKVIDVMVEFARALDLTVIAEGVETEDQRARLISREYALRRATSSAGRWRFRPCAAG
ncbi:hypothetical protein [Cupriavidus sp. D39]|uniref:hypothetical protein n=1 Tax=Cupriavidus sp. D39 TaxID=2997877 RepID=UPI00226F3747|nr:hypothetical protein [Cupriavidus sp. D39]MCY0852782.1 hypothetical protein [Cupriavidus sp. D39]